MLHNKAKYSPSEYLDKYIYLPSSAYLGRHMIEIGHVIGKGIHNKERLI